MFVRYWIFFTIFVCRFSQFLDKLGCVKWNWVPFWTSMWWIKVIGSLSQIGWIVRSFGTHEYSWKNVSCITNHVFIYEGVLLFYHFRILENRNFFNYSLNLGWFLENCTEVLYLYEVYKTDNNIKYMTIFIKSKVIDQKASQLPPQINLHKAYWPL